MTQGSAQDIISSLDEMTKSMLAAKNRVQTLSAKCVVHSSCIYTRASYQSLYPCRLKEPDFEMQDGISLLSLKHHLALSYLQSLTLLAVRRAAGELTATERTPPTNNFSSSSRFIRGDGAGDLVDSLDESSIVLDKIRILEGRMKYQIDKLVRLAEQDQTQAENVEDGTQLFTLCSS